jgi:hypothetical protein
MSFDRESIEAHVETTLQGMTIAAGYTLPTDLRLVTRELLDYDETDGSRPAAIIQFTGARSELVGLGGIGQSTLMGRIVFYFDLETGSTLAATWANQYTRAARDALLVDRSRGANPQVLTTTIPEEPTALLWKTAQALEATLLFEVLVRHEGGT